MKLEGLIFFIPVLLVLLTVNSVAAQYQVDANTVALYHADTGSEATLVDEAGNYNGTFRGPGEPAWTTDSRFGPYALHFDGHNDYITRAGGGALSNGTMEMWFKPDVTIDNSNNKHLTLWIKGEATSYFYLAWPRYSGTLKFEMRGGVTLYSTTNPFEAGTWYHVAVTWGSAGTSLYINGSLEDSDPTPLGLPTSRFWDFEIGGQSTGAHAFEGIIDEIRLSDIQRTFEPFYDDEDGDGVLDADDLCPNTVLPESVPTRTLKKRRYSDIDGDGIFETVNKFKDIIDSEITLDDTFGCTCEQILEKKSGKILSETRSGCRMKTIVNGL